MFVLGPMNNLFTDLENGYCAGYAMKLLEQMRQKIKLQGLSPKTFETYAPCLDRFYCAGYNGNLLDWRLAVKVLLWVIMRGSYAAPILDRYANPHVLPSKIGVLGTSF